MKISLNELEVEFLIDSCYAELRELSQLKRNKYIATNKVEADEKLIFGILDKLNKEEKENV